jgi:hypothetical protein
MSYTEKITTVYCIVSLTQMSYTENKTTIEPRPYKGDTVQLRMDGITQKWRTHSLWVVFHVDTLYVDVVDVVIVVDGYHVKKIARRFTLTPTSTS